VVWCLLIVDGFAVADWMAVEEHPPIVVLTSSRAAQAFRLIAASPCPSRM
jgi:hypothetical protein